jgi:predicted kinase
MKCYQMIGVPGSGKSTWIANQFWANECVIVSTDHYVERFARRMGKTYDEVFSVVMKRAVRLMMRRVKWAQQHSKDIIWDQTSTNATSRARKFAALPDYYHIAVVMKTPDWPDLKQRLDSRPGKTIPRRVIKSMINHWDPPSEEEGFQEIWYAQ